METVPMPNPRSKNPIRSELLSSALGILSSLGPWRSEMIRARSIPAIKKRIPIARRGGILSIT
jgi:hypothetical protein